MAAALLAAGCDSAELASPVADDGTVWFRMDVQALGVPVAIADTDAADDTESGEAADWALDASDIYLLLFDDTQSLIRVIDSDDYTWTESKADKTLNLCFQLNRNLFDFVKADVDTRLSVLALANVNHMVPNLRQTLQAIPRGKKLGDIVADLPTYGFNFGADVNTGWIPDGSESHRLPMAGLCHFARRASNFDNTTPHARHWLPDIDLLRAMAKIRVLDGIEAQTNLSGTHKITQVVLRGYKNKGYLLPQGIDPTVWNTVPVSTVGTLPGDWRQPRGLLATKPFAKHTDTESGTAYSQYLIYLPEIEAEPDKYWLEVQVLVERSVPVIDPESGLITGYDARNVYENYRVNINTGEPADSTVNAGIPALVRNNVYQLLLELKPEPGIEVQQTIFNFEEKTPGDIEFD